MAALLLLAGPLAADDRPTPGSAPAGAASPEATPPAAAASEAKARAYFTDRRVVTQHGNALRFYSDVLKGRTVVVTMFYAGCTGVCPVNNEKLAELQTMLGEAMGRDVFFVSLTVDPEHDSVEALSRYADKFRAGDGWLFLTGNAEDIEVITRRLGHASSDPEDHVSFFMLGNVPQARWTKVPPYEPAEVILERLKGIMAPAGRLKAESDSAR